MEDGMHRARVEHGGDAVITAPPTVDSDQLFQFLSSKNSIAGNLQMANNEI